MDINESKIISKITWRLMPYLGWLYLIAYIDRQNVGYAKLQMVSDIGLSEAAYGFGAGLFFIGYFFFEVPSNLAMNKVGARIWFARIMLTWGIVTLAFRWTNGTTMFYFLRFALGAAEAGFFPGVLFMMTLWFPKAYRGRMVGLFMIGSTIANSVGSIVGGTLMGMDGIMGLKGWHWVFLCTGVPAILFAVITLFVLPSRPEDAKFLSAEEKKWLADKLASEHEGTTDHGNPLKALADPRVLLMCFTYVFFPLGAYGLSYWLPTVTNSFGLSYWQNGVVNAFLWLWVSLALWWVPKRSAEKKEVTWHCVTGFYVAAIALVLSVVVPNDAIKFVLLIIAACGIFCGQPLYWSIAQNFLRGGAAAAGLAAINSVGNLGGFVGQFMVPAISDYSGSKLVPMYFLAVCLAFGATMVFVVQSKIRKAQEEEDRTAAAHA